MPAQFLRAQTLRALAAPERGTRDYWDAGERGLALRVSQGGARSWSLVYRDRDGNQRRINLGRFPDLGLADARKLASERRGEISKGHDPASARQRRREAPTFGEAVALYLDQYAKPHKRTWREDESMVRDFPAAWAPRKLDAITRAEVSAWHVAFGKRRGHCPANHRARLLRRIFNWTDEVGLYEGANPARKLRMFKSIRANGF